MAVAIVTGASKGLGEALATGLVERGWSVVLDARGEEALHEAVGRMAATTSGGSVEVVAVVGDVTDADHRKALVDAAESLGGVDLLVNNASSLGPSPLLALRDYPLDELRRVYEVDVVAPLALVQAALPQLRKSSDPRVINVTSDASVEAYEGWGGYGGAKSALDHVSAVLSVEEPGVRVWAVDPGDMRTDMHQDAFPGEDISDRPLPSAVVPSLLALIESDLPSGRYRASDVAVLAGAGGGGSNDGKGSS